MPASQSISIEQFVEFYRDDLSAMFSDNPAFVAGLSEFLKQLENFEHQGKVDNREHVETFLTQAEVYLQRVISRREAAEDDEKIKSTLLFLAKENVGKLGALLREQGNTLDTLKLQLVRMLAYAEDSGFVNAYPRINNPKDFEAAYYTHIEPNLSKNHPDKLGLVKNLLEQAKSLREDNLYYEQIMKELRNTAHMVPLAEHYRVYDDQEMVAIAYDTLFEKAEKTPRLIESGRAFTPQDLEEFMDSFLSDYPDKPAAVSLVSQYLKEATPQQASNLVIDGFHYLSSMTDNDKRAFHLFLRDINEAARNLQHTEGLTQEDRQEAQRIYGTNIWTLIKWMEKLTGKKILKD
ncbi:MAG TPA: hypothetical protein VD999_04910 [Vitreimonas sp.]|nr:hypothetical protein [Vitreimonas sp.]